jgi:hypothetical protein
LRATKNNQHPFQINCFDDENDIQTHRLGISLSLQFSVLIDLKSGHPLIIKAIKLENNKWIIVDNTHDVYYI